MKTLNLALLCVFCLIASCKKENNSSPAVDAKISKVILREYNVRDKLDRTTISKITYNAANNVDFISTAYTDLGYNGYDTTYYSTRFTYYKDYYQINYSSSAKLKVGLNGNGQMTYVMGDDPYYTNSNSFIINDFTYNGNGQLITKHNNSRQHSASAGYSSGLFVYTEEYEWDKNGNNVKTSSYSDPSNRQTGTYSYDLNRQGQTGDIYQIDQFLDYGRAYKKSKNVPVSVGNSLKFYYEYDGEGRITKLFYSSGNSANPDTTSYTYEYIQ